MLLDGLTAGLFRTLARLRGARAFHPRGAAHEAEWVPAGDLGWHVGADPRDAVVRVSRGVGLPTALPDVLGVAIKLLDVHGPDQHQDLLFASVAGGDGVRGRVLAPRRTFAGTTFSTVLPYDLPAGRTPLVASVHGEPSTRSSTRSEGSRGDGVRVEVRVQSSGALVGTAALGDQLPATVADDLRFDPWHTGPPLRPAGLLNRLRRPAYLASQQGRRAPGTDTTAYGRRPHDEGAADGLSDPTPGRADAGEERRAAADQ